MLTLPIMAVVALIGHLCLYWKYGRELYSVIRRRERDALFEDVHSHDKLLKMLKSYRNDAILYFVYIFLFTVAIITAVPVYTIRRLLQGDCLLGKYFHLKHIFIHLHSHKGMFEIPEIEEKFLKSILLIILAFPLLFIHISIMRKVIVRMLRKRTAMNNPTRFSRSTLYQPLIGSK